VHKDIQIYTVHKFKKRKNEQKKRQKHTNNENLHTDQTEKYENYFGIKCTAQTVTEVF